MKRACRVFACAGAAFGIVSSDAASARPPAAPVVLTKAASVHESRGEYAKAAETFAAVVTEDNRGRPDARWLMWQAAHRAGGLFEALERWDDAHRVLSRYVNLYPGAHDAFAIAFRASELQLRKGDFVSAGRAFEALARRSPRPEPRERLAALAAAAVAYLGAAGSREQRRGMTLARRAVRGWSERKEMAWVDTRGWVARAALGLAERAAARFHEMSLRAPRTQNPTHWARLVARRLKPFVKKLREAMEAFESVLTLKEPSAFGQAMVRRAELFLNFGKQLRAFPSPPGMDAETREIYSDYFGEPGGPFVEKAIDSLATLLSWAGRNGWHDEWTLRAARLATELGVEAYPIAPSNMSYRIQTTLSRPATITRIRRGHLLVDFLR